MGQKKPVRKKKLAAEADPWPPCIPPPPRPIFRSHRLPIGRGFFSVAKATVGPKPLVVGWWTLGSVVLGDRHSGEVQRVLQFGARRSGGRFDAQFGA